MRPSRWSNRNRFRPPPKQVEQLSRSRRRSSTRPETLQNRWDRLYAEFPDVYDTFSSFPYRPDPIDVLANRWTLRNLVVLDIGSGTGRSAIKLARHARRVIGVEPETAMRSVAQRNLSATGAQNVSVVEASKEAIPLPDGSVDAIVSMTGGLDIPEAFRVARAGALVASIDIAPHRYGGNLSEIIAEETPELETGSQRLQEAGFAYDDFESVQEFGSTEAIVSTYGFIFGRKAIEFLRATGQTSIRWTFRLHYCRKG